VVPAGARVLSGLLYSVDGRSTLNLVLVPIIRVESGSVHSPDKIGTRRTQRGLLLKLFNWKKALVLIRVGMGAIS
jgi:hypothetical protein